MAFVNEKPGRLPSDGWRTIDYERGAVLLSEGSTYGIVVPGHGGGRLFKLQYQGEEVTFQADLRWVRGSDPDRSDYHWTIVRLNMPHSLSDQYIKLRELISDGLTEWGYLYDRNMCNQVDVDFSYIESKI